MSATSATSVVVVDANLAIWAVLPVTARSDALQFFVRWRQQGLRVVSPSLWLAECTSAIRRAVYAGAISPAEGRLALDGLFTLQVEILPVNQQLCRVALQWAERLGQARAYDGFYLALAEEMGAELWTADTRLANGARHAGAGWVHSA